MLLLFLVGASSACKIVSFLSGGKCGSTALASYLKHTPPTYSTYDPHSGFVDAGKELCGSQLHELQCRGVQSTILDACPRRLTKWRATQTLAVHPGAVGVLLVRNQADALLSLYRDTASSGRTIHTNADDWVYANKENQQFNFTSIYNDAVKWGFSSIVTITTTQLHHNPTEAVNRVRKAMHLPHGIPVHANTFNAPSENARYRPGTLSYETKQRVEHLWHTTNLQLAQYTSVVI